MKKLMFAPILLLLAACAIAPPMSPEQRRAIQTRTFSDAGYDNVFRSFKSILQDEGYVIKNQDMTGGLITATIDKSAYDSGFKVSFGAPQYTAPQNQKMGEEYEVSVNLEKINDATVETRMTIQKVESYSMGGHKGQEVLDENAYKNFYDKVRTEIERRKAQGKG